MPVPVELPRTQVCRVCGIEKPLEDFHYTRKKPNREKRCKKCNHAYHRERRRHKVKGSPRSNDMGLGDLPLVDRRRYYRIRSKYGLSREDFDSLMESQDNKCASCRDQLNKEPYPYVIDHCHNTNKVRGILCSQCNLALGLLYDSEERIQNLLDYLRKSR